jgi:metal-responsive CopG/Arc/MetJ family transcriptional regulator
MSDTKIQLWLPVDQLEEFDRRWQQDKLDSRSSAIRQLIREYLQKMDRKDWMDSTYGKEGEV